MHYRKSKLHKTIERIFKHLVDDETRHTILEDLEERYKIAREEKGKFTGEIICLIQFFIILGTFFFDSIRWNSAMFKSYGKIAFRQILRHKGYSFINISGLATGMTCCILILLWVQDELCYDRFHDNIEELCRIVQEYQNTDGTHYSIALTPEPLGPFLEEEFPEIINATRYRPYYRALIEYENRGFYENGFCFADPAFFKMFTFPFISGDPERALEDPNSVVITESIAAKYFGNEYPVGKTLRMEDQYDFYVSGVIRNIPGNSHIKFDFIGQFDMFLEGFNWGGGRGWGSHSYYTYIQLQDQSNILDLNAKVFDFLKKFNPETTNKLVLQPVREIYLYSHFTSDLGGDSKDKSVYVYVFSIIALFVLLIACINFMNLTTARSGSRAKEIGMRKVTGAQRSNIIIQFFSESLLITFIALVFSFILVLLLLPVLNTLSAKQLTFDSLINIRILLGLGGIALITGIIAGSYPALFLSSFKPVKVLKGAMISSSKNSLFRKALVVIQFTLSSILIISTLVVYNQVNFIRNKKLGYNKDYILYFPRNGELQKRYESFKNELLQSSGIEGVTASLVLPTSTTYATTGIDWEGKKPGDEVKIHHVMVDHDYLKTFNMEITDGRDFSREFASDENEAYILNETAVRQIGLESPVGKRFSLHNSEGTIIGVVKDFHFKSLHKKIEPLVLRISYNWLKHIFVRISAENISETIRSIAKVHDQFNPDYPFEFTFLDEEIDNLYKTERQIGILFRYFTFLSVIISCLGLLGLTSYMVVQRTKEIGIRKVMGASSRGIFILISKEFLLTVGSAIIIAWPVSWFFMNRWLENFAYNINIGIGIFAISGLLIPGIALIAVSSQTLKAARVNPVDSLKYE